MLKCMDQLEFVLYLNIWPLWTACFEVHLIDDKFSQQPLQTGHNTIFTVENAIFVYGFQPWPGGRINIDGCLSYGRSILNRVKYFQPSLAEEGNPPGVSPFFNRAKWCYNLPFTKCLAGSIPIMFRRSNWRNQRSLVGNNFKRLARELRSHSPE